MRLDRDTLRLLEVIGSRKGHAHRSDTLRDALAGYITANADLLTGRAA